MVNYDVIRKLLTIYIDQIAIPMYKKKAAQNYIRAMGKMCDAEVMNAGALTDCWQQFKRLIDTYKIK